jgi:hypothetical protein
MYSAAIVPKKERTPANAAMKVARFKRNARTVTGMERASARSATDLGSLKTPKMKTEN